MKKISMTLKKIFLPFIDFFFGYHSRWAKKYFLYHHNSKRYLDGPHLNGPPCITTNIYVASIMKNIEYTNNPTVAFREQFLCDTESTTLVS